MKISPTMEAALVAIANAMPLVGEKSLAMLPCHGRTAQALEDRNLIAAKSTPTGTRWVLTDGGWERAGSLDLEARGCRCPLPSIAHEEGCPLAAPVVASTPLPTVAIPGHAWRWFNPQGGQPVSTTCIQLMGPGSDLTPVALINRNNDGTWHASGRVHGMDGFIAGSWSHSLTVEECALAIAAHLAGPPDISDIHEAATQAAFEATLPEIHEACGRLIKDHCAYCDTCDCGCPVADTIASTDGGIHAECGKPLADHCTNCDECPRVAGPCWCLSNVDAEDDGRPVADEPVIIVTGSTAPGFEIDFGAEVTKREVTRREAWSIVKRLEYAGVHVPDRLGMVDEVMSGMASYPRTPAEWRHVERCGPAGHCSCQVSEVTAGYGERDPRHLKLTDADVAVLSPLYRVRGHADRDYHLVASDPLTVTLRPVSGGLEWTHDRAEVYRVHRVPPLTVADVVTLMSPEEAVSLLHARERGWARRNKNTRSRRRRYARKGH